MESVSVIIPSRTITPELREAIPRLLAIKPSAKEILIVVDKQSSEDFPLPIRVIEQAGGPALKRDVAAQQARGKILAFLDDDAYPSREWLRHAIRHFADPRIAAVGGPAITPSHDALWAQVSGSFFTSWLGSGPAQMRYLPHGEACEIDDWPSVNLLVRKDIFNDIGGFNSKYWPGEDTKLCLEIAKHGKKIVYEPKAVCYHHRSTTLRNHLRQVARYGLHRGHFARMFPDTSWRISYFLPTIALLIALFAAALAIKMPSLRFIIGILLVAAIATAIVSGFVEAIRVKKWYIALLYPLVFFLSHTTYGIMFVRGLSSPTLEQYSRSKR